MDKKNPAELFLGVRFFINDSLHVKIRHQIGCLLIGGGATKAHGLRQSGSPSSSSSLALDHSEPRFDLDDVTHIITDTLDFPEYDAIKNANVQLSEDRQIEVVLPSWATRSFDAERILEFFSPDKTKIFSGLKFCYSGLPKNDERAIRAAVVAFGGQFAKQLTKDTTHLIVVAPEGIAYDTAMHFGERAGLVAVLPHWFDQCMKTMRLQPTQAFEFPNPPFFEIHDKALGASVEKAIASYYKNNPPIRRATVDACATTRILGHPANDGRVEAEDYITNYLHVAQDSHAPPLQGTIPDSLGMSHEGGGARRAVTLKDLPRKPRLPAAEQEQMLVNRRIYLASDLNLRQGVEQGLVTNLEKMGATVWSYRLQLDAEADIALSAWARRRQAQAELEKANVVIIQNREGWEFWNAYETRNKTIGNLYWIYHVLATGVFTAPLDRLLHYPMPARPIEGLGGTSMTVSNYNGTARDYVRAMVELVGASVEGSMRRYKTNYIVTAADTGDKVRFAHEWGLTVVNHLWLEDCIIKWSKVDPTSNLAYQAAYLSEVNIPGELGTRTMSQEAVDIWANQPSVLEERRQALEPPMSSVSADEDSQHRKLIQVSNFLSSATNDADRRETEETLLAGRKPLPRSPEAVARRSQPTPRAQQDKHFVDAPVANDHGQEADVSEEDEESESDEAPPKRHSQPVIEIESPCRPVSFGKGDPAPGKNMDEAVSDAQSETEQYAKKSSQQQAKAAPGASKAVRRVSKPRSTPVRDGNADGLSDPEAEESSESPSRIRAKAALSKAQAKSKKRPSGSDNDDDAGNAKQASGSNESGNEDGDADRANGAVTTANKKRRMSSETMGKQTDSGPRERLNRRAALAASDKLRLQGEAESKFHQQLKNSTKGNRKRQSLPALETEADATEETPSRDRKRGGKSALSHLREQDGNVSSFDNPPNGKTHKKLGTLSQHVRIWSTGANLTRDHPDIKKMIEIGARWVEDPKIVTHMISNRFARTQKFLSCLPYAQYFVTADWVRDSIKNKRILLEEPYRLRDTEKEEAIGDTLEKVLKRAQRLREAKMAVFTGKTFYVTKHVHPDVETVTELCQLGGGVVCTASLKAIKDTILRDENAIVLSDPRDKSEWQHLCKPAPGQEPKPIYTSEVIFESMQRQKVLLDERHRCDI